MKLDTSDSDLTPGQTVLNHEYPQNKQPVT